MTDSEADFVKESDAAFSAVADSTRIEILRALAEHGRETDESVCRFSELRKRAGVDDAGRFRYHLNKLSGHFVEKADQGYRLTHAGGEMIGAIFAGRYLDHDCLGPCPLDSTCSICGTNVVGTYESGRIEVACEDGHALLSWPVPPNATTDAALSDVASLATSLIIHAVDLALQGLCSLCYGPVSLWIEDAETDETSMPRFRARCDTCASPLMGPIWFPLLVHPAIESFYHDHGLSVRDAFLWELDYFESVATLDDEDVRVAVGIGDDVLYATVSETETALDIRVSPTVE